MELGLNIGMDERITEKRQMKNYISIGDTVT